MIVFYHCLNPQCGFTARVTGDEKEISLLARQAHTCPNLYCKQTLATSPVSGGKERKKVRELDCKEFYGAVNGMGFPEETVTHVEPVVAMLKSSMIIEVDATEVGGRCIVNSVTLDNGVTLHFAASGYGAAVFRATRRSHASVSNRADEYFDKQPVRGPGTPEEHSPRGSSDPDVRSEVHRRLRGDQDATGDHDRGAAVPPASPGERQGQCEPKVVRGSAQGEAVPRTGQDQEGTEEEGQEG